MAQDNSSASTRWLFWTCFVSLTATSFGFISRVFLADEWALAFNLSETQKGEIMGAGLWPFAISIVLFSHVAGLKIERTSYLSSGRVVEFTQSIYRGDAYNFVAELRISES